jgi:hypothetical protein
MFTKKQVQLSKSGNIKPQTFYINVRRDAKLRLSVVELISKNQKKFDGIFGVNDFIIIIA